MILYPSPFRATEVPMKNHEEEGDEDEDEDEGEDEDEEGEVRQATEMSSPGRLMPVFEEEEEERRKYLSSSSDEEDFPEIRIRR